MSDYPHWYILDENDDPQPTWLIRTHPITGETEVNRPFNEWLYGDDEGNNNHRVVCQTEVPIGSVSTVFLGLDHSFHPDAQPILFETMIFTTEDDHPLDNWQYRYCTMSEASLGHAIAVMLAESTITTDEAEVLLSEIPTNEHK